LVNVITLAATAGVFCGRLASSTPRVVVVVVVVVVGGGDDFIDGRTIAKASLFSNDIFLPLQ
jgi:hypothetical protein